MVKTRRLSDLYQVGRSVEFDDGTGDPITVYVRKLNPIDQETAVRRAQAARSRALTASRNHDSEEYGDLLAQAMDLGDKGELVRFLSAAKLIEFRNVKDAELAADDEWSKDGYLQGLYDSWNDGLDVVFADNAEDPEAKRVFDEMKRFTDLVEEEVNAEEVSLNRSFEGRSFAELQDLVAEELSTMNGDSAWVREYRRSEIWLCTREPGNHRERYFKSRDEVDELPVEVYNRLVEEIRLLIVDPVEGKNLPPTDNSSLSSEQPETAEVSSLSGRSAVTA